MKLYTNMKLIKSTHVSSTFADEDKRKENKEEEEAEKKTRKVVPTADFSPEKVDLNGKHIKSGITPSTQNGRHGNSQTTLTLARRGVPNKIRLYPLPLTPACWGEKNHLYFYYTIDFRSLLTYIFTFNRDAANFALDSYFHQTIASFLFSFSFLLNRRRAVEQLRHFSF